jgi:hypothetical protein
MFKITNTQTEKEVNLAEGTLLQTFAKLYYFDQSEGVDTSKLEASGKGVSRDDLKVLCDAGIIKAGILTDNTYIDNPDSTRYFINPLVAYFLYNQSHNDGKFLSRELVKQHIIHPRVFLNDSFINFWSLNDLVLPVVPANGLINPEIELESFTQRINEYLQNSTRFHFERV